MSSVQSSNTGNNNNSMNNCEASSEPGLFCSWSPANNGILSSSTTTATMTNTTWACVQHYESFRHSCNGSQYYHFDDDDDYENNSVTDSSSIGGSGDVGAAFNPKQQQQQQHLIISPRNNHNNGKHFAVRQQQLLIPSSPSDNIFRSNDTHASSYPLNDFKSATINTISFEESLEDCDNDILVDNDDDDDDSIIVGLQHNNTVNLNMELSQDQQIFSSISHDDSVISLYESPALAHDEYDDSTARNLHHHYHHHHISISPIEEDNEDENEDDHLLNELQMDDMLLLRRASPV